MSAGTVLIGKGPGRIRSVLLAVAIFSASPCLAQAEPDAARLAAARELMVASDIKESMRTLYPRMAEAMGQQMRQMFVDNAVPEGLSVQLTAALQANLASMNDVFTPAFIDKLSGIYARHFTTEELKRVSAMMRDPVMVRFRAETPAMMGEMMPLIFEAVKPRQQQFQEKLRQIVTDWLRQHPEDKAKLRSPTAS